MNCLTPHMAIPMLGHIKFCFFILCELVSHELQDLRGLFKHHELEYVHVVVQTHVEVLLLLQVDLFKRSHIVPFYGQLDRCHSLLLQRQRCLSFGARVEGVSRWVSTLRN